jgi:hypothetical protein
MCIVSSVSTLTACTAWVSTNWIMLYPMKIPKKRTFLGQYKIGIIKTYLIFKKNKIAWNSSLTTVGQLLLHYERHYDSFLACVNIFADRVKMLPSRDTTRLHCVSMHASPVSALGCRLFRFLITSGPNEADLKLRPTVSLPVYLGVVFPSWAHNHILFVYIWQLWLLDVGCSLWR